MPWRESVARAVVIVLAVFLGQYFATRVRDVKQPWRFRIDLAALLLFVGLVAWVFYQ